MTAYEAFLSVILSPLESFFARSTTPYDLTFPIIKSTYHAFEDTENDTQGSLFLVHTWTAYSTEVKEYSTEVKAYSTEVKAYSTEVKAYSTEVKAYSTEVKAYSTEVKAYSTEVKDDAQETFHVI